MSKGYIKLERSLMDNWLWKDKPFAKGQAWVDLLLMATWKENKEMYQGKLVQRKPGEIACSIEWLADRWGWNRKKVMGFLNVCEADTMLEQNRTPKGTTITIVNWEKYQSQGTTEWTGDGTTDGTPMGQVWDRCGTGAGHTIRKENKGEESIKNVEEREIYLYEEAEEALNEMRRKRDEVLRKYEQE